MAAYQLSKITYRIKTGSTAQTKSQHWWLNYNYQAKSESY